MFTRILSGGVGVGISVDMILVEFTAPAGVAGVAASVVVLFDTDSSDIVGTEGRCTPCGGPEIAVP